MNVNHLDHSLWGQYATSAFKGLKPATLLTQFNVSTVCQEDVGALSETNTLKPQHMKHYRNQLRTAQLSKLTLMSLCILPLLCR